jgi:reticulon-3
MKISDESMSEAAEMVGSFINKVLKDFENIALGKDNSLFYKVAFVLLLASIVGRLTDLITLVYTSKFFYCFTFLMS